MSLWTSLCSIASSLLRGSRLHSETDEELRSHIEHRADDLERSGLSSVEAARRARIEFGGYNRYKAEVHETFKIRNAIENVLRDASFSIRRLKQSPSFTMTAVVTLALGIGINAVVFSLVNALILRPLNVPQGQNLYSVERAESGVQSSKDFQSYPDYIDLRDQNRSFKDLILYDLVTAGLDANGKALKVFVYETSGNYFDVLGVKPYLGRFFHSSDEHGPNSAPYIVLGYGYWQSRFHGDRTIVGRMVQVNRHPFTVLGVAPSDFRGTVLFFAPDLWAPIVDQQQIEGQSALTARADRGMWILGRLKDGVAPSQASGDLNAIAASLAQRYPKEDQSLRFSVTRLELLGDMFAGPARAFVGGLTLLSSLILLAACANLGSLFSARTADRFRELALRLALGSSRQRIIQQVLIEAVLVSFAGGILGMAGGVVLLRWLSAWQPIPNIPINLPINPDLHTYLAIALLTLLSGMLCGTLALRIVWMADPYQAIKAGGSGVLASRRITLRDMLLCGQVAMCAVLLTSSLVAIRGLIRSLHSDFGFVPQHAILVSTDFLMAGYSDDRTPTMQRRMLDGVTAIPGVSAAAYAGALPLNLGWNNSPVFSDSTTNYTPANAIADPATYKISPNYFEAAKTKQLKGRDFTWRDDRNAPRVAMVNQEFAVKVFGSINRSLGGYFKIADGTRIQVVGIVENGKYKALAERQLPAVFLPILQAPSSRTTFIVRSDRSTQETAASVDRTLHGLDPGLPVMIDTWEGNLTTALFPARIATMALGVMGALGAMLAITGVFGMAASSVSKRLREIGIRMALGAQRKEVLLAVLGRTLKLLAFGSAAGLVLGVLASRVLASVVYQAKPTDPLVLGGVVLAMALVGLFATWLPAQRALGVDPVILLREE